MSSVSIAGDTSGSVILAAPAIAGANTATLPAATGTVMVSGNMPAFLATLSSNQTGISSATFTKVSFNNVVFDTNSNYSNTNYRYTPTIPGYYQLNWNVDIGGTGMAQALTRVYKNGTSGFPIFGGGVLGVNYSELYSTGSGLVFMNGTTDYVEVWLYVSASSGITAYTNSSFSGSLVRAA